MSPKFVINVDMDGTIADWNAWFDKHVDEMYPEFAHLIPRKEDNKDFNMWAGQSEEVGAAITHIFNARSFYEDIPEIPGALDALREMKDKGHIVSLVTSPWWDNETCLEDKKNWVRRNLGYEWMDSLIITRDKTMVVGDFLIDDKPEVHGKRDPQWTHVLYDQPYNRHIDRPRLSDWTTWENLLESQFELATSF